MGNTLSQETVFSSIWESTALCVDEKSVMDILQLIVFSLRPLTTHELLDLVASSATWDKLDISDLVWIKAILLRLPGILTTRGNEVCLSHRHLRDFILSTKGSKAGVNFGEDQHRIHDRIADLCLIYLLSSHGQLE